MRSLASVKIKAAIEELEKHLETEMANTARPGNPYIMGISGKISGLKMALKMLEVE